ncbi:MAG: homocysteine S-methyltransferase family protein, partial [Clostridiales bacterium]|nr:homocysteine S-methyltransferase family protein [Clostridiales bacterium]
FIAFDIGPTGRLLKPYGTMDFEEAVDSFKFGIKCALKHSPDLIFIETFNDLLETKAALLAAKESCELPVFVSNAYDEDLRLLSGSTPECVYAMCRAMGADAIGANCSFGPDKLRTVIDRILKISDIPVIFKPNAGIPVVKDGKTVFNITKEKFGDIVSGCVAGGVRAAGGCCGTTPEYIEILKEKTKNTKPRIIEKKSNAFVCSESEFVEFGKKPVIIGERLNPTGKKRLKEAIVNSDLGYILQQAVEQQEQGADILDVNAGVPGTDEATNLKNIVFELQNVVSLPLQLDSGNAKALENALRIYKGKAVINSVNGKKETLDSILPLAKKYGGVLVALTLDENGIPETPQGRFEIAKRILNEGKKYGLTGDDFIFDPLAMSISSEKGAALTALKTIELIKNKLHCNTILGVSNISFGMPERSKLNSAFLMCAMERGLSGAIVNPASEEMMNAFYTFNALHNLDKNYSCYLSRFVVSEAEISKPAASESSLTLEEAILKGLKDKAGELTEKLLEKEKPLEIIESTVIPALDKAGNLFENKKFFLPQLLMSADAAKEAFEKVKSRLPGENAKQKPDIILATVKGDIHDIGKNIVKLLCENYGFGVLDLGKDVEPSVILETVKKTNVGIVGLSALMTTTVPAMEETIILLKKEAPDCKTIVGGAVLTQEYAEKIGATCYAKDAMATVRTLKAIKT